MKHFRNLMIFFIVLIIVFSTTLYVTYKVNTSKISSNKKEIIVEIPYGTSKYKVGEILLEKNLIRNEFIYKLYLKLNDVNELKAGTYSLNESMDLETIIDTISDGRVMKNVLFITFKEGKTIKDLGVTIEANTKYKKEDFYELLEDKDFLKELIKEYWFLDDSILNDKLYYPLEGYLYPDTYDVYNLDLEQITKVLLNNTLKKLTPYKEDFEKSEYSIHELMTLASIVELEAKTDESRKSVAAVFYNRLDIKMPLGSDVTTYYAEQKSMKQDLWQEELDELNGYNTRNKTFTTLPIGPIASVSISSIEAIFNPTESSYLYFVADKNGKVYLMKTHQDHLNKIAELKAKGLWFTYD